MIKVLVVDDEKLVRKGIIGLIEWEKYGMEVAGEAGSGEEAVSFLKKERVDLLFADLEMPGLSGMAFLERAKQIRPQIQIVVLTMHQEFEMIQQALRLGILDYITKAQIEAENLETFMNGIASRYQEQLRRIGLKRQRFEQDRVYLWKLTGTDNVKKEAERISVIGCAGEMLDHRTLLLRDEEAAQKLKAKMEAAQQAGDGACGPAKDGIMIRVEGVRGKMYDELNGSMGKAIDDRLFMDYVPGRFLYAYACPELEGDDLWADKEEVAAFWTGMEFMTDDSRFAEGLDRIKRVALTKEERIVFFFCFHVYWQEFTGLDTSGYFEEAGTFDWWYQWELWFKRMRSLVVARIGKVSAGDLRNVELVHRAMNYIREHMDREISLDELLQLTGMSKSHFTKCFKKVTGKTFIVYLNDIRIDAAKKYLAETRQPVYWIASQVGYGDEHYFRRIFRKKTGESPKGYREKYRDREKAAE